MPSIFIMELARAAALDEHCSLRPPRAPVCATMAALLSGVFSAHFRLAARAGARGCRRRAFFATAAFAFGLAFYKFCLESRRCIQMQYAREGAVLEASCHMLLQMMGVFPALFIIALGAASDALNASASLRTTRLSGSCPIEKSTTT